MADTKERLDMRQITKHNRAGKKKNRILLIACMLVLVFLMTGCGKNSDGVIRITNVSYDPTREFYEAYNPLFEKYYEDTYGKKVEVIQSHGGSGAQARSVVEGCNADVVTLALEHDITLIEQTGLIDKGWQKEFDKESAPYTSTIVFLVRKGNPKKIRDWDDLIQKNVEVITPDPKSSAGIFLPLCPMQRNIIQRKRSRKNSCESCISRCLLWIPGQEVLRQPSWKTKREMFSLPGKMKQSHR